MTYKYKTRGTCSSAIEIETDENNVITDVHFVGGCNGNTNGVSALVKGMNARDVIDRLEGIQCGFKGTSCPDQLAKALRQMLRTAE